MRLFGPNHGYFDFAVTKVGDDWAGRWRASFVAVVRSRPHPRLILGVVFDPPKGRLNGVVSEGAGDEKFHWVFFAGHSHEGFN